MTVDLIVTGLSHKTAPVEMREKLAVEGKQLTDKLIHIRNQAKLKECVLITTCNRVEVVAVPTDPQTAYTSVVNSFNSSLEPLQVDSYIYQKRGEAAVRHLFRVASGLEAMVLGEPQILGQVKDAYAIAQSSGTVGRVLSQCFERAFATAKRVRTETSIATGQVSVSSIACQLAEKIFGELQGRRVLLIGAGEMSEMSARALKTHGTTLMVINRSKNRADQMAERFGGQSRSLESLFEEIKKADVIISSTSKADFVIHLELIQRVIKERKWRPLFLIDIAVPRDIDPRINSLDNVFLYNIDDLQQVSKQNLAIRKRDISSAEEMIESAVIQFQKWQSSLQLTPTIVALKELFSSVIEEEKRKTCSKLVSLTERDQHHIDAMCEAMVKKLLHKPFAELKRSSRSDDSAFLIDAIQKLFQIEIVNSSLCPNDELKDVNGTEIPAEEQSR